MYFSIRTIHIYSSTKCGGGCALFGQIDKIPSVPNKTPWPWVWVGARGSKLTVVLKCKWMLNRTLGEKGWVGKKKYEHKLVSVE